MTGFSLYCLNWKNHLLKAVWQIISVILMPDFTEERLFNVWLDRMMVTGEISEDEIAELPFVYMEKVDIAKKVVSFANAKLFGKKYSKSF